MASLYGRGVPAYRALVTDLRRRLANGEFPDGRLPSAPALEAEYDTTAAVVRDALRWLRFIGITTAQTSRGTMARPPLPERTWDMTGPQPEVDAVKARLAEAGIVGVEVFDEVSVRLPSEEEVRELNVPEGLPMVVIDREYRAGGRVVERTRTVEPGESLRLRYKLPD